MLRADLAFKVSKEREHTVSLGKIFQGFIVFVRRLFLSKVDMYHLLSFVGASFRFFSLEDIWFHSETDDHIKQQRDFCEGYKSLLSQGVHEALITLQ